MGNESVTNGTFGLLVFVTLHLAVWCYAVILQTPWGRWFANAYTWASVVIGVGMVLGALALVLPWETVEVVFLAFAAGGVPMIARSLHNDHRAEKRMIEAMRKR